MGGVVGWGLGESVARLRRGGEGGGLRARREAVRSPVPPPPDLNGASAGPGPAHLRAGVRLGRPGRSRRVPPPEDSEKFPAAPAQSLPVLVSFLFW